MTQRTLTCSGFDNRIGEKTYPHQMPFDSDDRGVGNWPSWVYQPGRAAYGRIVRCKDCDTFRKTKHPPATWVGIPMIVQGTQHNVGPAKSVEFVEDIEVEAPPPMPYGQVHAVEQYDQAIGPQEYHAKAKPLAKLEDLAKTVVTAVSTPAGAAALVAPAPAPAPAARKTRSRAKAVPKDDVLATMEVTADSHEYVPNEDLMALWRAVVDGTLNHGAPPANIIFFGPSGSGKSRGAKFLADSVGLPFLKVDAASMTDPEAWFGTREVIVEQGVSVTKYIPSALVHALQQPGMVFVDEMNRVDDEHRNVWLPLTDGTGHVMNPLTGDVVRRHPHCFIVMAGNRGMQFTGTSAVDPAFTSRAYIVEFEYLEEDVERRILQEASDCDPDTAYVFAKFAQESRAKALGDPDFNPISTREAILACQAVARGLSRDLAAKFSVINAASAEGAGASVRTELENIWNGVRLTKKELVDEEDLELDLDAGDTGWSCPTHGQFKVVPAGTVKGSGNPYPEFRSCPVNFCEEAEPRPPKNHGVRQCPNGHVNSAGTNTFCSTCGAVLP